VCARAGLNVFTRALVDLFCPPTTTATVLPIPHLFCPSSPHFAKFVSSGNVCGTVGCHTPRPKPGLNWPKIRKMTHPQKNASFLVP
jgi:hypothetical protein